MSLLFTAGNYMQWASIPSLSFPFSMVCWWKPGTAVGTTVFGLGESVDDGTMDYVALGIQTSSPFKAFLEGGGGGDALSVASAAVDDSTWYLLAGTWRSATDCQVWLGTSSAGINNSGYSPNAHAIDRLTAPGAFFSGGTSPGAQAHGRGAYYTIWEGYALTATDVANMAGGTHPLDISTADVWTCVELESASSGTDISGNGNNATIHGSPTLSTTDNPSVNDPGTPPPPPTNPVIEASAESSSGTTAGVTSHVVTLPAGITAGELLLVILAKGSTAATINALAGWTELLDENSANGLYVAYRVADGSEGASITLTSSAATRSAQIAYRISNAEDPAVQSPEIGTTATASSTAPNPPSRAVTGGPKDILSIAFLSRSGEEADDDTWTTAAPASYSGLLQKSAGTSGTNLAGMIAAASRQVTTSSEDPGNFTIATGTWRANTIVIHPAPSGTAWDPGTIADSAGITDGVSIALGRALTINDAAGLTDARTLVSTFARTINDAAGITDARTISEGYVRAINDAAGITDALSAGLAFVVNVNDGAGITDALVRSTGYGVLANDALAITDAASLVADFQRTVADAAGITDAQTFAEGYVRALADGAGITDSTDAQSGRALSLADALGVSDAVATLSAFMRTQDDTASLTDALRLDRTLAIADVASITDALSSVSAMTRTIADAMLIDDSIEIESTGAKARTIDDVLTITDQLDSVGGYTRQIDDALGATDSLARTFAKQIADTLSATDATTTAAAYVRSLADGASIADAIQSAAGATLDLTDDAAIADSLSSALGRSLLLADTIEATDQLDRIAEFMLALSDGLEITDDVAAAAGLVVLVDDVLLITDAQTPILFVGGPIRFLGVRLSDIALTTVELTAEQLTRMVLEARAAGLIEIEARKQGNVRLSDEPETRIDVETTREPA